MRITLFLPLALCLGAAGPAAAQQRGLTLAVMPTQYFAADARSAEEITSALHEQYERQGYSVVARDRAAQAFRSADLSLRRHYADSTAIQFGRSVGADLVAYPRLLALGIPMAGPRRDGGLIQPAAVLHLRVLNTHTGRAIYFRQIAHEFLTDQPFEIAGFRLPAPVAEAASAEVTQVYFEQVAGSRQEFRGSR